VDGRDHRPSSRARADWSAAGIEGVVAKRLDGHYVGGQRGWRKLRARAGTEAVVGGVTGSVDEPETLLLGRFDVAGRLRFAGRTSALTQAQRGELGRHLTPLVPRRNGGAQHPWPQPLPAAWSGQLQGPRPLPYVQVEPVTVVEIEVDTAHEHGRWRHPVRYRRVRPDLSVYDVPLHMS
jgi:ATP-dependent DNA ligase